MEAKDLNKKVNEIGIVPVIKFDNPKRDTKDLAEALNKRDVPIAEITFRAEGAPEAIAIMKENFPDMFVGAGTVTNKEQIDQTIKAGGEFLVTPGYDEELVSYAEEKGIPIYPGCTTPSDYHAALKHGLEVIKFFPAEQSGGLAKIKAMSAPFPMFKVIPTGGISLNNLKTYLAEPCISAYGGSFMVTPELINNGNWEEITELCKEARNLVKEARE